MVALVTKGKPSHCDRDSWVLAGHFQHVTLQLISILSRKMLTFQGTDMSFLFSALFGIGTAFQRRFIA